IYCLSTMNTWPALYDKPGVLLTKPIRIGEFSCHANNRLEPNARNLRYLIHVDEDFEPLFDLDAGFNNWTTKKSKDYANDLLHLQEWAISERSSFNNDYKKVFRHAEIVCCRGTMTDIAKTPFFGNDPWRIVAFRHEDIIYLHNCGSVDGQKFDPPPNSQDAHSVYWGHSFQRMMTSSSPDLAKLGGFDDSERVDCRETYSVVYRSDIIKPDGDRIKLLYSSEIKAIDQMGRYIDFKTQSSHLYHGNWLKKAWFWWLQCHLASADRIYLGFKSNLGIVHKIRVVERVFLRNSSVKQCNIVMNFLTAVLSEVKKQCIDSVQIRYCPESRMVHFESATRDSDFLIPNFVITNFTSALRLSYLQSFSSTLIDSLPFQ
ncbi:hypothetical protein PRIPAC_87836, partial [Pristionchus pacificus]